MRALLKPAAALAFVTSVAGCAADVTAPQPAAAGAAVPTGGPSLDLGVAGTASAVTTRQNAGQCLDVAGAVYAPGTRVILWTCSGGGNEQFTWTAAGEMRSGGLCLDAAGGQGRNGDKIIVWTCTGAANQRWARTSAGELKGINGKCIDVPGGNTANGVQPIIWDCNGGTNQEWDTRGASTAAPAPAPAPGPTPSTGGSSAVLSLMGRVPSVGAVEGLGGAFAKYEQDFRTYADQHWSTDGVTVDADYYDRAMIYYVWWARTGNAAYLDRANRLAVNYRKNFLEARGFNVLPYETFVDGIALHYLLTGDEASRTAVGKVADRFATARFIDVLGNTAGEVDNRDQARVLTALLVARWIKAPSATGTDWAARARTALGNILRSQSSDGAYRFTSAASNQCGHNKPWMVGLLNDAMTRYYTGFEADSRIVGSVKRSLDYIWAKDWRADRQAIVYLDGTCNADSPYPAADLNNLVSSGFGFVYKQTGDATYRSRGDAMFAGAVSGGWLAGSKQFNQEYTSSYRYLGER